MLIACNWLVYVYAATSGQVLQASLGYFINPLLTILLGVFVLHERRVRSVAGGGDRPGRHWLIAVGQGSPPWLALALAFSFGLYSLAKNLPVAAYVLSPV